MSISRPNRQILTIEYIRRLIENNYIMTCNYFQFTTLYSITLFIQSTYSTKITLNMVKEAMELEPPYKFYSIFGKLGCRYLIRK